jgi:gluconolactonase
MYTLKCAGFLLMLFLNSGISAAGQNPALIEGIGPIGEPIKVHTGFVFTEGPAVDEMGNMYFTDLETNRVYKSDANGNLAIFLEDSRGCNGLMFDSKGRLLACQGMEGRVIAIDVASKTIEVIANRYGASRFNGPNDLVIDRQGGIYFSDPFSRRKPTQREEGVYYVSPKGKVTRLVHSLLKPNGVLLSPNERTLYVLSSAKASLMTYPIKSPGRIGAGKPLGQIPVPGDGLTVDAQGNLYVTQPALKAILVLSPEGTKLGMIKVPEAPINCSFGGKNMKTLFVTARTSLYAFPMQVTGHRFGAS